MLKVMGGGGGVHEGSTGSHPQPIASRAAKAPATSRATTVVVIDHISPPLAGRLECQPTLKTAPLPVRSPDRHRRSSDIDVTIVKQVPKFVLASLGRCSKHQRA